MEILHQGDGYTLGKEDNIGIKLWATKGGVGNIPSHWVDTCIEHQINSLDLRNTGVTELPEGLIRCRDLQRLYLSYNGLGRIPSTVNKLTTLELLRLSHNQIKSVTSHDIGNLLNLEVLYLDSNPNLQVIGPKLGHQLKKLRWLYCGSTGLAWRESPLTGFRLRELQLAEHGAQALPTHQNVEPAIDSLVIYHDQDREIVTTKGLFSDYSLCGRLQHQGHSLTPASDLKSIRLGLQNCKAVVLCIGQSFPLPLLTEVLKSKRPIMVVKLYQEKLHPAMEKQLSQLKAQGFLIEYGLEEDFEKLIQFLKIKVPIDILARGPAAVKIFQQATEGGVVRDQRFRVISVGMERVGKTSLIKNLTGKRFDPNERITHLIDVVKAKSTDTIRAWDIYQTEDGKIHSEQEYLVASEIAKKIKADRSEKAEPKDKEPQDSVSKSQKEDLPNPSKLVGRASSRSVIRREKLKREVSLSAAQYNIALPAATDLSAPELSEVSESFIELVKELLEKDPDTLQESLREIHLWDFGGQQLYYSQHKVFLSSAAIYMVVFDLTKKMNDPATEWMEDGLSNGQVLEFWLDSIYAYTKSTQPLSVLLVGTHAGQVNQEEINNASTYIRDMLNKKTYRKNIVKEKFRDTFYTVENSLEFAENSETQRLKKYIEETLIPGILEKRENQPLRWLEFEKKIKALQTEDNQEKQFANLDEVKELAVQCKVIPDRDEEETLMTVLQFLHDIGSIIYYGAEDTAMRDLVILRPEWLLEVFRKLIVIPRPAEMNFQFEDSWTNLKEKHILDRPLLDYVLGYLQDSKSSIIHLLMKYDFFCERVRGKETAYYVPFVLVQGEGELPDVNKREPHKVSATSNNNIFIIEFYGFLPAGVFHQLAVKTLRWSEQCRSGRSHEPEIYYRYLAAPLESQHIVSLEWMPQHQIKVFIKKISVDDQDPPPELAISNTVLRFLERSLVELQKMGLKSIEYDFLVDLDDYPSCTSKCGCRPQLRLNDCLEMDSGAVHCPNHLDSLIKVTDLQKRFNAHRQTNPDTLASTQGRVTDPSRQRTAADSREPDSLDVLISYQWDSQPAVKRLYDLLTRSGFKCWMDIHHMGGGDSLFGKIEEGLRKAKVFLPCITKAYARSVNCKKESSLAYELKKPIIPVLLERSRDCWLPDGLGMIYTGKLYVSFADNLEFAGSQMEELKAKISQITATTTPSAQPMHGAQSHTTTTTTSSSPQPATTGKA